MSLFKIREGLTYYDAARIISFHFKEIEDRLINILELASLGKTSNYSQELIVASINQKIDNIKMFKFNKAIDLKKLYKYTKALLIILIFTTICFIYKPDIYIKGAEQILHHRTVFEKTAPFNFILLNESLKVEQGSDLKIKLKIDGLYIPERVYMIIGSTKFLLSRDSANYFSYLLSNINNDVTFHFYAEDYNSKEYKINVIYPPLILDIKAEVNPPAYTGLSPFVLENTGDLIVPAGSKISWKIKCANASDLKFFIYDSLEIKGEKHNDNIYSFATTLLRSSDYVIVSKNDKDNILKKVEYFIKVIPDNYPTIGIDFIKDSSSLVNYYFKGTISDDYGFTRLTFNIKKGDSLIKINLPISQTPKDQEFYFSYNFSELIKSNDKIEFYFEVFDNDAINKYKSTKSQILKLNVPTKEVLQKNYEKSNEEIKSKLNELNNEMIKTKNEIENFKKELLNTRSIGWEQMQKLQSILEKQRLFESTINQIKNEFKQRNNYINTFSEQEKEILEKQQQLQKILENIMDEELKQMINKINELLQKVDKERIQQITKEFEIKTEELSKELDRAIELFKKLEIEEKTNNIIKELEKLSEEQNNLSQLSENKKIPLDSLKDAQKQQSENFENLRKEYENLLKENNQLQYPFMMQSFKEEMEAIQNEFNIGTQHLEQNNRRNASKSQKKNSIQIKQLSEKIQNMMQQSVDAQAEEDENTLNFLFDNLLTLSFNQEEILNMTKKLKYGDPFTKEIIQKQSYIRSNLKVIEDSLNALAKRNPLIDETIKKHLKTLKTNLNKSFTNIEQSNFGAATVNQQTVMAEANELALIINQILQQMNQESDQMCAGSQCKRKSKKNSRPVPGYDQMKNLQQQLKNQLQSLLNELEKRSEEKSAKQINEQIAKMISIQDKFMQMLNRMMQQEGISPESMQKLKEIKNITEELQREIANKNITRQTLMRQEQILTRLLEAEKSDREREIEQKRESNPGKNDFNRNFFENLKYNYKKATSEDFMEFNDLPLQKFYEDLFRKYIINLKK
ncbi:MAG: hypothetical protein N3A01_06400 [Bacteroidales bacterium]|nr:hypothetical protein [Bacteroidales bacterium]